MVGTIEPRKGHLHAIAAFDQLWADGVEANLVIIGKEGWKGLPESERRTIPATMRRLREHPQLGRRLFWLDGADDAMLTQAYRASACLLYPSEGEGFGLPLIEAASHGLPLIVRDLPVFREVAGEYASYFDGDGGAIAVAVRDWLVLREQQRHPGSAGIGSTTWQDNVRKLLTILDATYEDPVSNHAKVLNKQSTL